MIKIASNTVLDYSFSGASHATSNKDVVYINEIGGMFFDPSEAPLGQFENLKATLQHPGGLESLLSLTINHDRTAYVILDEMELNQFLVHYFQGLYKNLTADMLHRLIKLTVVDQKYGQVNRPKERRLHDIKTKLIIPSKEQTIEWFVQAKDQPEISYEVKKHLGIEYLLAHSLAVDFAENDEYVQLFAMQMNDLFWTAIVQDYLSRKRRLFMGVCGWHKSIGKTIDLLADDVDEQIQALNDHPLFRNEIYDGSADRTKENTEIVYKAIREMNRFNGVEGSFKETLASYFANDQTLSIAELKSLVYEDRTRRWSKMFGRNKAFRGVNSILLSYLFSASPDELQDLVLN